MPGPNSTAPRKRNLARARELYLVNRAKYVAPEEIDVSHILFDIPKRGKGCRAGARRERRQEKSLAGADFAELAQALSDDPSVTRTKGGSTSAPRGKIRSGVRAGGIRAQESR